MSKIDLDKIVVKRIIAVNKWNITHNVSWNRLDRGNWAIAFKLDGRSVYKTNEKNFISDASHALISPKGVSYTVDYQEFGECVVIEFEAEYNDETSEKASIQEYSIGEKHDFHNKVIAIEHMWSSKKPAYELYCMSGLYELIAKLRKLELSSYYSSRESKMIEPSLKYIQDNYKDCELSYEDILKVSGLSDAYFRKLFTIVMGTPPMRYLQTLRIEKAKDLLSGDYMPITDIADAVGFKNVYYFSKTFKQMTGHTPTEYAKRMTGSNRK